MTSHQNRLNETVLMMGPNIRFKGVIWKIIPKLSPLLLLIWSTVEILIPPLICGYFQRKDFAFLQEQILVFIIASIEDGCSYQESSIILFKMSPL